MKQINTTGLLCPAPLIMMKRAINAATLGEWLEVVADNHTSACNLAAYLKEMKIEFTETTTNGKFSYRFQAPAPPTRPHSTSPTNPTHIIVIKGDKMGHGDDALGQLLLRAYINALPELPQLPVAIIFYNRGVMAATEGADTLQALRTIEARGVRIIACGTCLDFYNVKEKLAVGSIGNMYTIAQLCADAGHIVYP